MENMQYAKELVREFIVFRGFTNMLQTYEAELSTEIGRNFEVDKILDSVFSVYIPKYKLDRLLGLFNFFKQCFTSPADTVLFSTLVKLEQSVLRYYVVNALKSGKQDKVVEFFGANGNHLMQKRGDWMAWFVPYVFLQRMAGYFGSFISEFFERNIQWNSNLSSFKDNP